MKTRVRQPKHTKQRRGFASMSPEKQRAIAAMGGRQAHANGSAHRFTSAEARAAGVKGGAAMSRNAAHMREIGRRGGRASGESRRRRAAETPPTDE